jgi:hypothetical protein
MNKFLLLLLVFFLVCISCKKPEIVQTPYVYNYNYFPLEPGTWKVYKVQSITVDAASDVYDTLNYYLKEVQAEWFLNASNDSMMRLERYYKDSLNQSWKILSVWQMGIVNHEALSIEDNIIYVRQKFPLSLNATWNGDAYNRLDTLQKYTCEVTAINSVEQLGVFAFDSVLTISQKYQSSFVDKVDFEELYAYKLGLIFKKQIDVYSSLVEDSSIPVENKVTKGTMYYQELIDYGNE